MEPGLHVQTTEGHPQEQIPVGDRGKTAGIRQGMHTFQEGGAPEGAIPGLSSWIAFLESSILEALGRQSADFLRAKYDT
jgi:hypothetical protein